MALPIRATDLREYIDELPDLTECRCVAVVVRMTVAEAHARAAHKIERDAMGSVTLATENRPMADAISARLVEGGYGVDP